MGQTGKRKQAKTDDTGWTPVRRGDVYCSPLCGGGCTVKQYEEAKQLADAAVKALGPGWKPIIWENLGWHSKVVDITGCLKVHVEKYHGKKTYLALLGEPSSVGGYWTSSGTSIKKVVEEVHKKGEEAVRHYAAIVGVKLAK